MENTLPKRAVIYIRVATKSQLDDFAMENQSARLHQQAERDKVEIVGEIRAYEKGLTIDRPGLRSAINLAIEQQADAIFVTGADRVARKMEQYNRLIPELDKHGISLYAGDTKLSRLPNYELLFKHYEKQVQ